MAAAAAAGLSRGDLLSITSWSNLNEVEAGLDFSINNSGLLGVLGGVSRTDVLPSPSTIKRKDLTLVL